MGKEDIWSPRPQEDVDFRTPRQRTYLVVVGTQKFLSTA